MRRLALAAIVLFALLVAVRRSNAPSRSESRDAPVAVTSRKPAPAADTPAAVTPEAAAADRARLLGYVFEAGGQVAFVSADDFVANPDQVRWYVAGKDLPDGPITCVRAPDSDVDAWLGGLAKLPPFPVLVVWWSDLTDAGVAHVATLGHLEAVKLAGSGAVTDAGVQHLRHMTSLRLLDLGATHVTDGGLVNLQGLTNLESLSLYATPTSDRGLWSLRGLTRLESLHAGAFMSASGLAHLRGARNLRRLDMNGSEHVESLEPLRAFPALEWLNLSLTSIDDASLPYLAELKQLEVLDLSHTAITDAGMPALEALTAMRRLDLSGLKVTDAALRHVRPLVRLEELRLTGIGDEALMHLTHLPALRILDLTDTRVTAAGVPHLTKLRSLRELWLPETVTAAAFVHLRKMTGLREIFLSKRIPEDAVTRLEQALPDCAITRTNPED